MGASPGPRAGPLSPDFPELRFRRSRGPLLLLAIAVWLAFFQNLGSAPLFDRDEGAFSEATREMVASGNYISTTLNGEPRYDKPILTYYLQAAGVAVLGWDEWGVRIPSALAATLWVLAVWGFARRQWDETTGWVAGLITATSLWVMVIGRAATADALLNLFLALTLFDLYRFWHQKRRAPLYRVFLWSALGFLTKGPVAVAIPLASAFLLALVRGQLTRYVRAIFSPVGWLIFFAVAGPWYAAVYARDGQAFIDGFFLRHNLNRFADTMEGHGGVLFYYVPVVFWCWPCPTRVSSSRPWAGSGGARGATWSSSSGSGSGSSFSSSPCPAHSFHTTCCTARHRSSCSWPGTGRG